MKSVYEQNRNKPWPEAGLCPKCGAKHSKIQWGWHGVYYDTICENGHIWTYNFQKVTAGAQH